MKKAINCFCLLFLNLFALSGCSTSSNRIYYQYVEGEKVKIFDINQQKFETSGIVNYGCAVQYKNNKLYVYGLTSDGYNHSTPTSIYKYEVKVIEKSGNLILTENNKYYTVSVSQLISVENPRYERFCTKAYLQKNGIQTIVIR